MSRSTAPKLDVRVLLRDGPLGSLWAGTFHGEDALIRVFPPSVAGPYSAVREAIRKLARIDHPGVAPVLEFGVAGDEQSRNSGGMIPTGQLYAITEAPSGKSLQELTLSWRELRSVVMQILDALGHLHARGTIHGDLGPGGIEIAPDGTVRIREPGLRLAAMRDRRLTWDSESEERAPELRQGRWRDTGPWTDLYALARLVRSALGAEVLAENSVVQAWVERLVDRRNRLLRVADARRVLLSLEGTTSDIYAPMVSQGRTARRSRGSSDNLVGRDEICRELWEGLTRVQETRNARVIVLRGQAGVGKTALADWLCNRAHETGVATVLRSEYGHSQGRGGLSGAIVDYLDVRGLEGEQLQWRVLAGLGSMGIDSVYEQRGIVDLIVRERRDSLRTDGSLRDAMVRRFLQACSDPPGGPRRPVILCLEDVESGLEAVGFARSLVELGDELPVLVVLTTRQEPDDPNRFAVDDLLASSGPKGSLITLDQLAVEDQVVLARDHLGVPEELAHRLAFRTHGNPLHAVQLVEAWQERGLVRRGADGRLEVLSDRPLDLPDAMDAVWLDRLGVTIPSRSSPDWLSMEIAAVLGRTVVLSEWREVCRNWGLTPGFDLIAKLADRELLRLEGSSAFHFTYVSMQQALEKLARREGRVEAHHRACAVVLAGDTGAGAAERRALHHLGAGDIEFALEPLVTAAQERALLGDFEHAERLVNLWESSLERQHSIADDFRRTIGWTLLASIRRGQGRSDDALELARKAEQRARWCNDGMLLGKALLELGLAARELGDLGLSLGCLTQSEGLFERENDDRLLARARLVSAGVLGDLGAFDDAELRYEHCRSFCQKHDDGIGMAESIRGLGDLAIRRRDLELATVLLNQARREFEALGHPWGAASCYNSLGTLARAYDDLLDAERNFRSCTRICTSSGSALGANALMNQGMVLLLQERYAEAGTSLAEAVTRLEALNSRGRLGACHVYMLAAFVDEADWAGFDSHYGMGIALLMESEFVHQDIGLISARTGSMLAQRGQPERARQLLDHALRQYRMLGMSEEIAQIRLLLEPIPVG
ncbi:MAG: hypothetical protein GY913_26630 [Proteobacteria bacterium]|nr:hypothetical protein [Pseudomonadota bacterium]MCP4920493.1 hypothetical protein [Pseudomonadota bacterium]